MKKSVILMIGIIYVVAIAIVSFFGMQVKYFNDTVYINKIECTNEEIKIVEGTDEKYILVNYINDPDNPTVVQLEWHIYPENATRKIVKFQYDENSGVATVSNIGTVIFKKPGVVTVYIVAGDGQSQVKEKVKVIAVE